MPPYNEFDNPANCQLVALLGILMMRWNMVEHVVRELIITLLDESEAAEMVIAHMGTVSLFDALRTLNNELGKDEVRPHVDHFIKFADVMREYRNYYAHGIFMFGQTKDGQPGGVVHMTSAKSRLVWTQEVVTCSQIQAAISRFEVLIAYGSRVLFALEPRGLAEFEREFPPQAREPGTSSLEMPPLPDKLKKPRRFPRDAKNPPQSSEA